MIKTISSKEYEMLLNQLVKYREREGFSQVKLAEAIGETQSTVSKIERGERRLDIIELFAICAAIGISPVDFVEELYQKISERRL